MFKDKVYMNFAFGVICIILFIYWITTLNCTSCANNKFQVNNDRMYLTSDIDPYVDNNTNEILDSMKNQYTQRTAQDSELSEFRQGSSQNSGGVDIGPFGLAEYAGRINTHDDGIPSSWTLPETPIRWYTPVGVDHYGPKGPTVYSEGLFSLTEPDHRPRET